MSQYYYTLASLPMLSFDMERPLPIDEFLGACRSELGESEYRTLVGAASDTRDGVEPDVLKRWRDWETTLRNELARLRAARKGVDAQKYLREADFQVGPAEIAREAMTQDNPFDAEEVLSRARWRFLDELESGHFFDLERLIVYFLRLQILHRRAAFDRERGTAGFQEAYQKIARDLRQE